MFTKTILAAAALATIAAVTAPAQAGVLTNGKNLNGISTNGKNLNGISVNGRSANGRSANGRSTNGKNLNGLGDNGQSAIHDQVTSGARVVAIEFAEIPPKSE